MTQWNLARNDEIEPWTKAIINPLNKRNKPSMGYKTYKFISEQNLEKEFLSNNNGQASGLFAPTKER